MVIEYPIHIDHSPELDRHQETMFLMGKPAPAKRYDHSTDDPIDFES